MALKLSGGKRLKEVIGWVWGVLGYVLYFAVWPQVVNGSNWFQVTTYDLRGCVDYPFHLIFILLAWTAVPNSDGKGETVFNCSIVKLGWDGFTSLEFFSVWERKAASGLSWSWCWHSHSISGHKKWLCHEIWKFWLVWLPHKPSWVVQEESSS